MGKHFGNLQKIKGITYYSLSPYELKPFKGCINPGIKNVFRRFYENLFYFGIPVLILYTVIDTSDKIYNESKRKNPDDYKDDV